MPNFVTLEIVLVGRQRPLRMPRIGIMNVYPALQRIDDLREANEISEAVAAQAEGVLRAIDGVGR